MSARAVGAVLAATLAVAVAQSVAHLLVVLELHRIGTVVDLDRSNGLPDLASTGALGAAAVAGALVARRRRGGRYAALAVVLTALFVAELAHRGAHLGSPLGNAVILLSGLAGLLLLTMLLRLTTRGRALVVTGLCLLTGSFLSNGLDRYDQRFERSRGDPVAEYQIVAKEGLELVGFALVALALWNEALRAPTAPTRGARTRERR